MENSLLISTFLLSALLSWWLTSQVRKYALKKGLMDIPNARSLHDVPTPRGGGLSIVIVLLISIILTIPVAESSILLLVTTGLTVMAFALLGWQDDKHDLSAAGRFLIQLVIASLFSAWLLLDETDNPSLSFVWVAAFLISVLWIVWMANLYNFMDGIDGLSAAEALILGTVTSLWFYQAGSVSLALTCLSVAGAALGFLYWNWSPAKIFMGDVGSLALGAFFAIIALIGSNFLDIPLLAFLILYGVFLMDSSVTLLFRVFKGEKWWEAHRSHYYQRAVQTGYSHAQVSLVVTGLNLLLAVLASLLVSGAITAEIALPASLIILAPLMFLINYRFNRICRK